MYNSIFTAMITILVFITLIPNAFAHVSFQQRYNDGYGAGQNYAACDYNNCDNSAHGYDTGCSTDKKHTYEYCQGYSLGYQTKWNSLAHESTTTQQSQAQAQDGFNVNIDGSHNNVVIAPRQVQVQSSSGSLSDSQYFDNTAGNGYR
ncbi:MAG TPA: hypothetical protein VH500_05800 [Nitrososphaeraceae archaeon]|jgi:hypothetical protein